MKSYWLHRGQSDKLILFCCGWGMDETPFAPLTCGDWDVLMLFDYSDLDPGFDISLLFDEYREVVLVAWSMGVWAGQQIFSPLSSRITNAIAINGTLRPVDDRYGISEEVVQATHDKLDVKQRLNFYRRTCKSSALYQGFLDNQPRRSVESQKRELGVLLKGVRDTVCASPIYNKALVANQDFIMPTKNQLRYWPEDIIHRVDGPHFLFYGFGSWEKILAAASVQGKP